ncbi:MAG: hypothetical protein R2867_40640 [Caldilineaceae bacterium]
MAGALIWQLNDCWLVTGWALVDYELRPKSAYYAVKRALAPLVVEPAKTENGADLWVQVSQLAEPVAATVHVDMWTLGGERLARVERILQLCPTSSDCPASLPLRCAGRLCARAQPLVDRVVVT